MILFTASSVDCGVVYHGKLFSDEPISTPRAAATTARFTTVNFSRLKPDLATSVGTDGWAVYHGKLFPGGPASAPRAATTTARFTTVNFSRLKPAPSTSVGSDGWAVYHGKLFPGGPTSAPRAVATAERFTTVNFSWAQSAPTSTVGADGPEVYHGKPIFALACSVFSSADGSHSVSINAIHVCNGLQSTAVICMPPCVGSASTARSPASLSPTPATRFFGLAFPTSAKEKPAPKGAFFGPRPCAGGSALSA